MYTLANRVMIATLVLVSMLIPATRVAQGQALLTQGDWLTMECPPDTGEWWFSSSEDSTSAHFIASGEVVRMSKRIAVAHMQLENDTGELIATGSAAYIVG